MGSSNIVQSFSHAITGILDAIADEKNLRIHFLIGTTVIALSLFLNLSKEEILWLSFAVFSVIGAELLNTLIEELMDFYSEEVDMRIKRIKDIAAGIVLWYSLFSIVVGVIVLGRALFKWHSLIGTVFGLGFLLSFPVMFLIRRTVRGGK